MTLDELIELLQAERKDEHYGKLPIVMCTQSGSGEVDAVTVAYDPGIHWREEIRLLEKP